jgi:DNA-binding protein HU-beta
MAKKAAAAKKAPKATKAPKAAKSDKAATFTLRHLGVAIAEGHDLPKKQVNAILEEMIGQIRTHLKKGNRLRIAGLGILQVRKRAARMGRNPATGEAIKIKASKKIAFRAAKDLKELI